MHPAQAAQCSVPGVNYVGGRVPNCRRAAAHLPVRRQLLPWNMRLIAAVSLRWASEITSLVPVRPRSYCFAAFHLWDGQADVAYLETPAHDFRDQGASGGALHELSQLGGATMDKGHGLCSVWW